jgi:hypothetical protein
VTEQQWLGDNQTKEMLRHLLGLRPDELRVQDINTFPACRATDRKLRLFACACYHRIRHLLPDQRAAAAVAVAEQFADGLVPAARLRAADEEVRQACDELEPRWRLARGRARTLLSPIHEALALGGVVTWREAQKAAYYAASNAHHAFAAIRYPDAGASDRKFSASQVAEERAQTQVIRDIFGNPFRPVSFDPRWRTADSIGLASAAYEDRAFDRLPLLADALQDAGCDDEQVLGHCRSEGPHVRGCFVVDLVLRKE